VDVSDEEEEVVMLAELSGVKKEDISLYASKDGYYQRGHPATKISKGATTARGSGS